MYGQHYGINKKYVDSKAVSAGSRIRAYQSVAQAVVPYNTYTKIQFNAKTFDTLVEFDEATNYRFTATTAGYYKIHAQYKYTVIFSNEACIAISKNGTRICTNLLGYASSNNYAPNMQISDLVYLNVGEWIEIQAWHYCPTSRTIATGTANTFVTIEKLV